MAFRPYFASRIIQIMYASLDPYQYINYFYFQCVLPGSARCVGGVGLSGQTAGLSRVGVVGRGVILKVIYPLQGYAAKTNPKKKIGCSSAG